MRAALLAALVLAAATPARPADTTAWPPPKGVQARMQELHAAIRDPDSTLAQREAARAELARLLKSPAAPPAETTKTLPPRAAIDPYPSVVRPLPPLPPPPPGVAHLEVAPPPKPPVVNPQTGSPVVPSGKFAVDPTTGALLHEVPGGYVDPRTGQFIPR
jgi:hypothetical protein